MRSKQGTVTSTKQQKTIIVTVAVYKTHPKYKKRYMVTKKYHVDNPEDKKYELGTTVTFYETRPLSKLKCWTVNQPQK